MLGFLKYLSLQMEHPPFHFHDWKQEYDLVDIVLLCGMDHIIITYLYNLNFKVCKTYLVANCVGGTPSILVMPPNILPNYSYHNHSWGVALVTWVFFGSTSYFFSSCSNWHALASNSVAHHLKNSQLIVLQSPFSLLPWKLFNCIQNISFHKCLGGLRIVHWSTTYL